MRSRIRKTLKNKRFGSFSFGVERLENRQLLSATLSVSQSLMVFNAVQNSSASPVETLTLTNTGDAALSLNGLSVVNDPSQTNQGAARFSLTNAGSAPTSLAAGASFGLQVDYSATSTGLDYALLDISSSDPNTPLEQVQLHGIGTAGLGGGSQPSLERILLAYGEPNYANVGESNINSAYYPEPPAGGSDEVALQELVKAGNGPVTIDVLASFTASSTKPYTLGWYNVLSPGISNQQLFYTPASESQSVYVQPQGVTSFDPGSTVFGFYNPSATVKVNNALVTGYTQDSLNTWDTTDSRKFRFFPLQDANGNAVANSYIMTSTEWYSPAGYDFTNLVAIVSNVKAAPGAPGAPVLTVNNPDALPDSNTLLFNRIENPNTSVGDTVHDTNTITLENTGGGNLTVSNITVTATTTTYLGGTQYQLVNPPSLPFTLAAGQSKAIEVQFVLSQPNANGHSANETNSAGNGGGGSDYPGILSITSNSSNSPTMNIPLAGWWQEHSENSNEPDLQTMVNMMAGYGTEINPSLVNFLTESTSSNSSPVYYGEEVVSGYWTEADSTLPVTAIQIAAFHTQGANSGLNYYAQGSNSTHSILSTQSDSGQAFFPLNSAGSAAATGSFSTTGSFGFEVLNPNTYSDDAKNVGDDGGGHLVRFFPVRDAAGNLIPNTYILACDYPNGADENFDFNDNDYLVTNIRPVISKTVSAPQTTGGAAAPAAVSATETSAGVALQWAPVLDSSASGYDIYSSLSPTTGYALIGSTPATADSYLDATALPGETVYYRVCAVDSTGIGLGPQASAVTSGTASTSLQTIAVNESPTGSTTTITPNQAYTVVAGGPGVTGTSDGFRYLFAAQTGNFDVAVKVSSLTVAGNFATAGIMASDSLGAGAANVYMSASPSSYRFKFRSIDGGTESVTAGSALTYPNVWVRLTRVGNVFSGYTSSDGVIWTLMSQETLSSFPSICYLGLAVASNTTSSTTTAQLTNYGPTATYTGPITTPVTYSVVSEQTVQESVLAPDVDATGTIQPSTFVITTPPSAGGTASFDPTTGLLTYASAAGFIGTETLAYTVADNNGAVSSPTTITFNVASSIPVAVADSFQAVAGQPLQLNILTNDTDAISTLNPASVIIVTQPGSGATLTVDPGTGAITYLAPITFKGTDTFTYTVADYAGQISAPGTVTVTVAASNPAKAPVLANSTTTASANGSTTVNVPDNADSTVGLDLSTLAVGTAPAHGTTSINSNTGVITYTPLANFVGPDSFTYTVANTKGHTSNVATVSVNVGVAVGNAAGDDRSLTFTSAGGAVTTVSLNIGSVEVLFSNDGTLSVDRHGRATVKGSGLQISSLDLSGTNAASTLSIAGKGKGTLTIGGIVDNGSIRTISAPKAILSGAVKLGGIGTLQVLQISDAQITIGKGIPTGFSLIAGTVSDTTLSSAVAIKSIKATAWTTSMDSASTITAPSITSLAIAGAFQPTLTLSGGGVALKSAQIKGNLGSDAWKITGNVGTLVAGSATSGLTASVSGGINNFTVRSGGLGGTLTAGSLNALNVTGGITGSITAGTARTVRVVGNVQGATLDFTGAGVSLNTLSVSGAMTGDTLTTTGNAGSIIAALLSQDTILIGAAAGTTLSSATASTVGKASLNALRLTARTATAFSGTTLIVHTLKSATLGVVDSAGAATDGIALVTAGSITGSDSPTPFRFTKANTSSDVFGTFEIRLVTAV